MVVTPAKEMTGDFADSRSRHTFIVAASKNALQFVGASS
jgi:hypothetical protein